ncbi:hypothetical protein ACFX2I_028827 [Malus domestica]
MCSSQPSRIKPQRPLKKLPTKFKIKPRRPLKKITSPIQDQVSTTLESKSCSRSKLWKINKLEESRKSSNPVQDQSCGKSTSATKYVPIHPLPKPKDHLPHEAPCGPISTFKIKPRRPLKKSQAQFKIKPQRPLKKSLAQFKIKPQTALGSTSTIRDFKTHLLHVTSTCIRRALKWGHL